MWLLTSAWLGTTGSCTSTSSLHPPLCICQYNLALTRPCLVPRKPSVDFIRPYQLQLIIVTTLLSEISKYSGQLSKQTSSRAQGDKLKCPWKRGNERWLDSLSKESKGEKCLGKWIHNYLLHVEVTYPIQGKNFHCLLECWLDRMTVEMRRYPVSWVGVIRKGWALIMSTGGYYTAVCSHLQETGLFTFLVSPTPLMLLCIFQG